MSSGNSSTTIVIATAHSAPRNPCAELRDREPDQTGADRGQRGRRRVADDRDRQQALASDAVRLSCEQEPGDRAELRDRADPPGVGLAPTEVAEDERQDERKHERVVALEERRRDSRNSSLRRYRSPSVIA